MPTYPIKTVVVLVQENRSFDHIIGWMKSLNPEINGVTGAESNPISTSNPNSDLIYFGDRSEYVDPDPGHSFQAIYEQVFGAEFSINSSIEVPLMSTYDEHGGFYDHVPTPVSGVPSPDGIVGPEPFKFRFDRLGVRVPTIIISPWIERGTVVHGPNGPYPTSEFEHSSIPATVKKIFNLKEFLTKRDAWAGTFESVLTRRSPRSDCPVTLPDPKKLRLGEAKEEKKLSEFEEELVQMAAVLNGDHRKDIYPKKLVATMTVGDAVKYTEDAFKTFLEACENRRKNGADESEIVVPTSSPARSPYMKKKKKSFACLVWLFLSSAIKKRGGCLFH